MILIDISGITEIPPLGLVCYCVGGQYRPTAKANAVIHPSQAIRDYKTADHPYTIAVGDEVIFGDNDVEETMRIFLYLVKHQELCEDDNGDLLSVKLVAAA